MSRIFICYRREDTSGHAGRLYDRLRTHYGDDVFMDIDAIGPGADYADLIEETINSIEVALVMIGRHWLDARDPDGRRRLEVPDDLVRQEVSEALTREVLVIPVLVQDSTLPEPDELPPDMASLARRNAIELSDERWNYDADRLVDALDRALAGDRSEVDHGSATRSTDLIRDAEKSDDAPERHPGFDQRPPDRTGPTRRDTAMVLAVSGAVVVAIFGFFVLPGWHDELIGIRLGVAAAVVVGTVGGLTARRWSWVMAAGAVGLLGFGVWILALVPTHQLSDLMSFDTDGITNGLFLAASATVLLAGWLARSTTPSHPV